MKRHCRTIAGALLTALLAFTPGLAASGAESGLMTDCTVLVGYAENGGPHGDVTLIVPGTLIPALEGEAWPSDLSLLQDQLKSAYRLKKMREATGISKCLDIGATGMLPPADGIEAALTLIGFNEKVATYRAEMTIDDQLLASASLSVSLGGRAVMGSRLANAAHDDPYVFLVVETATPPEKGEDVRKAGEDGTTIPKPIETVNPKYPEEARKNQISGLVNVEVLVDLDGTCKVVKIHNSPDDLLSEAASEAVEQWKFAPGLDPQGKPTRMKLMLTIKFALK